MQTIQELASCHSDMFEIKERPNGDKIHVVRDKYTNEPDYYEKNPLGLLVQSVHKSLDYGLADDYLYDFIVESFDAISECNDIDDVNLDSDIYNHELLKWLSSHANRVAQCDKELERDGSCSGFIDIISTAQYHEKNEVLSVVKDFIQQLHDNQEEETNE